MSTADLERQKQQEPDLSECCVRLRSSSRGPGTAFLFALTIVEKLLGEEKREEISGPMILSDKL